jgi:aspartyl protease family protein
MNDFFKVSIFVFTLCLAMNSSATPTIEVLALFSERAMLRIDNKQQLLKVGDISPEGVTLISATSKKAVVEYEGKQFTIEPTTIIRGEIKPTQAVKVTYEQDATPKPKTQTHSEVIISADINDQYLTTVNIDGHDIKAIVDTGANTVAMSAQHANTLGIDYMNGGMVGSAQTASGVTPMHMVTLNSVKVGDIEVKDVNAAVLEGNFPDTILLGMTFLNEVHLAQEKGVMKLTQKNQTTSLPTATEQTNSTPLTTPVVSTTPAVTTPPQN